MTEPRIHCLMTCRWRICSSRVPETWRWQRGSSVALSRIGSCSCTHPTCSHRPSSDASKPELFSCICLIRSHKGAPSATSSLHGATSPSCYAELTWRAICRLRPTRGQHSRRHIFSQRVSLSILDIHPSNDLKHWQWCFKAVSNLNYSCLVEPARLPGFHTTVGGGGEKHDPSWYKENGASPSMPSFAHRLCYGCITALKALPSWLEMTVMHT